MQAAEATKDGAAIGVPVVVLVAEWYALGALLAQLEDERARLCDARET